MAYEVMVGSRKCFSRYEEGAMHAELGRGALKCDDGPEYPFVSIVVPTRNNESDIARCLRSLNGLDYPRDRYKVIVADGRSKDRTVEIAKGFSVEVIFDPGKGKGRVDGLNAGINFVQGDYVAFTDADCVVDSGWLKKGVRYFTDDSVAGVGGHAIPALNQGPIVQAITFILYFFNSESFLTARLPRAPKYVDTLGGASSIFDARKIRSLFPIPETVAGEDAVLSLRVRDLGYKLISDTDLNVWHYPHYSGSVAFGRQMSLYARGRVQMMRLDRRFSRALNWAEGLFPPLAIVVAPLLFVFERPMFFGAFAVGALALLSLLILSWRRTGSLRAAFIVPASLVYAGFGYSIGFLRELLFPQ